MFRVIKQMQLITARGVSGQHATTKSHNRKPVQSQTYRGKGILVNAQTKLGTLGQKRCPLKWEPADGMRRRVQAACPPASDAAAAQGDVELAMKVVKPDRASCWSLVWR